MDRGGWWPLDRRWVRILAGGFGAALLLTVTIALALRLVPLPQRLATPPSQVVAYEDGTPAHVFLAPDERYRIRVTADEVDPDYIEALIRFEDKRYWRHPGIDLLAILRSAKVNIRNRRILTGASTITMQVVRLLEPRPRTVRSKLVEAVRAWQLEHRLSKQEILSIYLTFTPFGRNLEGIEAASWAYFGHSSRLLSPDEIAVLLAVPQRPAERFPSPPNRRRLRSARDEIGRWLLDHGVSMERGSESRPVAHIWKELSSARVPSELRPLPRRLLHASFWLRQRYPRQDRLATTIDLGIQERAEAVLQERAEERSRLGIHNGSIVVIDHREGHIRALVGNVDFWSPGHGAQIAGFDVSRSAGSALKPFVYALGLDRGLVLPERLVPDLPRSWGSYAPENYDRRYRGLVTLEDALTDSLNLPFAELLGRLGVERFVGTLRLAGLTHLRSQPGYYGLSAAVGAVELTPLEMATLYAALAHGGVYRNANLLASDSPSVGLRIVSPGAAYLTRRALSRRDRPDFPRRRLVAGAPMRVHWKTGTSAGHRDAWAVGSGPRHTVVVWLGNFDREPSLDLVGATAAGPLLFRLLEAIESPQRLRHGEPFPPDLGRVEVCRLSGHLPAPACPTRREVLALRHQVPADRCPYHFQLTVDRETGLALGPGCRAGRSGERSTFVVWPVSYRRWLGAGYRSLPTPPALAAGCLPPPADSGPIITWPPAGESLLLIPGVDPGSQEVPLEADSAVGNRRLAWFVNGAFVGATPSDEALWWQPSPGRHELLVVDDGGLTARRALDVSTR